MKPPLSANEFTILTLLWEEGRALSRPEIIELTPDRDWNPNLIHLILNNMIDKGVLKVAGLTRCGRGYGRTYTPTMSRAQYAAFQVEQFTRGIPADERLSEVLRAMLEREPVSLAALDRRQAVLDEARKTLL